MKYQRITMKMVEDMHDCWNKGYSVRRIADKHHCATTTVRNYLNRCGVVFGGKKRKQGKYYKGKYLIALYDMQDNLVEMFDSISGLSNYLGRKINYCSRLFTPSYANDRILHNGVFLKKVLIEVE